MSIEKTITNLETLKINYLTEAMYEDALENGQINDNELYMTPSSSSSVPTADTLAEFDSTAHMNSTDMTTAEVTSFVNSLDLTGSKAADYIVEQGTSGIWTYRKWASGIAECWGTYSWAISTWTQWGSSIYYSTYSETINYPTGLFTSEPVLTTSQNGTSNDNWLGMRSGPNYGNTKDHTNSFFLLRPSAGPTDMTAYVYAHAIGRWK